MKIYLEKFTIADIKGTKYLTWLSDNAVTKYLKTKSITEDGAFAYVLNKISKRDEVMFKIISVEGDGFESHKRAIGTATLTNIHNGRAKIGIMIGEAFYRGKGIGKKVLKLLEKYATMFHGVKEFYLDVHSRNVRAINLYLKKGYHITEHRMVKKIE